MTTTTPSPQPGSAKAGTSQALELGLVHGSAPCQRSIEVARLIWKAEVTSSHHPLQTVTEIAQKIEDVFYPKTHNCQFNQDLTNTCMVCGSSVLNDQS